jgi:hypothetical protein
MASKLGKDDTSFLVKSFQSTLEDLRRRSLDEHLRSKQDKAVERR